MEVMKKVKKMSLCIMCKLKSFTKKYWWEDYSECENCIRKKTNEWEQLVENLGKLEDVDI